MRPKAEKLMKPRPRHIISLSAPLLLMCILAALLLPNPAFCTTIDDFLCELGLKFYKRGNYAEALGEFKKALIYNPHNKTAPKYIKLMTQQQETEQNPQKEPRQTSQPQPKKESAPKLNYGFITRAEQKPQIECRKEPEITSKKADLKERISPPNLRTDDRSRRRERERQVIIFKELNQAAPPTGISDKK